MPQSAGLGSPDLLACPSVRMPGGVVLATAAGLHLAGDRRLGAAEPSGDRAQRLAPADPEQDLLAVADRERPVPRLPAERLTLPVSAIADHEADHRRRAADLPGDVDQTPAVRPQPKGQLLLLCAQVPAVSLHQRPPVSCVRSSHRNVALTA
jgi:hypothetical protein